MSGVDETARQRQRRAHHALHAEQLEAGEHAHHVDDGVDAAQLVQVDAVAGSAVDGGLHFPEAPEDGAGAALDGGRDRARLQQGGNFRQMPFGGVVGDPDLDLQRADAGLLHPLRAELEAREMQVGQALPQLRLGDAGGKQRAQQHVAADAGDAVDVGDGHRAPPAATIWRTMAAAISAAPKPLSIFTTATPAAQELSIASSAAPPPRCAP